MGYLLLFALLLALFAALAGYACFWKKIPINSADYPWRERRKDKSLDKLTDEVLAEMSLAEKVQQLAGDGGPPFLLRLGINVLLLGRFPNTYAGHNPRLQIPPLSFSDGPRGVVIGRATCFPVAMARAASWDIALEQRVGHAIGCEVRAVGANYFAGLCINLLRHPGWGRAQECYGEDPYLSGEMGVALLQSVQRHQVMVCAKHFAANSIENSRFYVDVQVDKRTLHEVYLPHFKKCVDAGVSSLMSAYNKLNGDYCGHNDYLLNEVLRKQWGFKGFVSSDWLWGIYETTKPAKAGMDVEMPYARYYGNRLLAAVKRGDVDEQLIHRNARRVVRSKLDFVSRTESQVYGVDLLACAEHRALAQEVAEKSMVLLKNTESLLPLNRQQLKKIVLVGALAVENNIGDHGSSRVSPPQVASLRDGLQRYIAQHSLAVELVYQDGKDHAALQSALSGADIAIVVAGYRHNDEGENLASNHKPGGTHKPAIGGDRASLSLHDADIQLISAVADSHAHTMVCLVGGSAIVTSEWEAKVQSILMAWYPGMEGGHAFARIVFGDVNPSGKLPFSVPKQQSDLVGFDAFAETAQYDAYHGYTRFDKQALAPAYAFGFGLSYSSFSYMMLSLDTQELSVDDKGESEILTVGMQIKNTGTVAGEEVLQLYIGFAAIAESTGIERPHKLLRGFRKIKLDAGDEDFVSFDITLSDLKRYDAATEQWLLDKGEYEVMVGPSSRDQDLIKQKFSVV